MSILQTLKDSGFVFPQAREMLAGDAAGKARQAHDAALATAPNVGIPVELSAYIDPRAIEIRTAKRGARELAPERLKGDWTTPYEKFRVFEPTGSSTAYSDYANGAVSSVNNNWAMREQYVFQTTVAYGDFETAASATAKINLAADKQYAAAMVLDIDCNKFYLRGVAGRAIYGFLNDPNLPAAITAATTGASSSTLWSAKDTQKIYKDITDLFAELVENSGGLIDQNSPLTLVVSPQSAVELSKATDHNISVLDMIKKYFTDIEIHTLPELATSSGKSAMLYARSVLTTPTVELGYSEKMRAHRIVAHESSYTQKFSATTYGAIIYQPYAIATMTGI